MIAKASLGLVGLGAIGIGSVAFAKPEWLGINKEIPWTPLSQDKGFSDSDGGSYKEKFGGKYKNYLTGIVGTDKSNNDSWWEKAFKSLTEDKGKNEIKNALGNGFKDNVTGAIKPASGTGQYLREICDTIYKAESGKVTASPDTSKSDEYKESDVWKYCSPLGQKPKTIKEAETTNPYSGSNLGKSKEDKLISVKDGENDKFWEIRDKEFKGLDGYVPIEQNSQDKFFKNIKGTTIKELCKKAYGQNAETSASSETAPTEAQAIKYCSLDKSSN